MKKILLVFSILFLMNISNNLYSQTNDTITNYVYAHGSVRLSGTGKHVRTVMNFGDKYPTVVNDKEEIIEKCKELESGVDLMNYMSDKGWECFDSQIIYTNLASFYTYNFRRVKK